MIIHRGADSEYVQINREWNADIFWDERADIFGNERKVRTKFLDERKVRTLFLDESGMRIFFWTRWESGQKVGLFKIGS